MKLSDILNSLLIILMFIGIYSFSLIKTQMENIKKNWPKYRCNPTIMPFAETFGYDGAKNFTYCIQSMQGNYMNYLLTPIHHITSNLGNVMGGVVGDINTVRERLSRMTSNIMNITSRIFGIFSNIMIEFQKMLIRIKNVLGKTLGILIALINILSGTILTGRSIINGPIGDTLRFVKGL